ncbi:MAG: hypothetical protein LBB45_08205, partial [Methanobrevibacter sp.]|nr:hypothetical protein [Candidatus Methanovirga basalitermitum]
MLKHINNTIKRIEIIIVPSFLVKIGRILINLSLKILIRVIPIAMKTELITLKNCIAAILNLNSTTNAMETYTKMY